MIHLPLNMTWIIFPTTSSSVRNFVRISHPGKSIIVFDKVVEDFVQNREVNFDSRYQSLKENKVLGDFWLWWWKNTWVKTMSCPAWTLDHEIVFLAQRDQSIWKTRCWCGRSKNDLRKISDVRIPCCTCTMKRVEAYIGHAKMVIAPLQIVFRIYR